VDVPFLRIGNTLFEIDVYWSRTKVKNNTMHAYLETQPNDQAKFVCRDGGPKPTLLK